MYKLFHHHYHKRYHGQYGHARKLFIIDMFLLIGALVVLGAGIFFFFWRPGIQEWIDLKISFGENRLKSGESVAITINYTNRSEFNINDISLAVHLPPGFVVDRTRTPESEFNENSILNLSELPPGAKGQKNIYGTIWSEPKTQTDIIAIMSYRQENSKFREQKLGSFILNLPESVLQSSLELETTSTLANTSVPYTYKITNTGEEPINLGTDLYWGNNTKIISNYDDLVASNQEVVIEDILKMPGKAGNCPLQIKTSVLVNGQKITQLTDELNIEIYEPRVALSATIPSAPNYAEPGQTLPVEIYWKNNSENNLISPTLQLNFTPGTVDLKTTARENNLKVSRGGLLVSSASRTALFSGAPGDSDKFTINLKLLPRFNLGNQTNAHLEISPVMTATLAELPGQNFVSAGQGASILLATEMSLTAQTRYYTDEGDQLGRGPLPMQVGETTKYWVFIQANNTTNPAKNASFSATLAPGIEFTGKQSVTIGQPVNYNPTTRALTWSNYALPANSRAGLYFEVAVNPTPEQINEDIEILKNIKFSATDSVTGKGFNLVAPDTSTKLPASDRGANL